ncbi:MFS transporter [Paenibacillus sp. NPDC058071]|uniref:MFS transporter n=1 Tax=Paenibacillus sp. NPDC058071 TaxID=3346326 RepID=UPI0036D7DAD7
MNLKQSWQKWLGGYPKDALGFIAASFANAIGGSILWPLTTLYVHQVLGRSYGEAGMVLLFQALAGVIGQLAGGALYHRLGPKRLIVSSMIISGGMIGLVVFTREYWIYVIMTSLYGLMNGVAVPAINAYIGFRWPEHRRKLYNAIYVGNNVGLAIGASVGGLIAAFSFSLTYVITAVSTLAFGLFLVFFMQAERRPAIRADGTGKVSIASSGEGSDTSGDEPLSKKLLAFRMYLFLGIGQMLFFVSIMIWNSGIAPYLTDEGYSLSMYSLLWTINGIVIFAGQPITNGIKRLLGGSLRMEIVASSVLCTVGYLFIAVWHDVYWCLVIGMIICTLGEMLLLPVIPTFFSENAGKSAPFYMGIVGGFGSAGRMIAPTIYGTMYDHTGIAPVLYLGAGASLLSFGIFVIHAYLHRPAISAGGKEKCA